MAASSPAPSDRWLQGPVSDVVLGGGLLYVPILAMLLFLGSDARASMPYLLVPILLLLGGNAHVGATLLRVYERPEDRRAYSFFSVWVTLVIAVLCALSFFVSGIGSVMITFYLTIVPWHFTGQNYGVALVLLRRHGIDIDPALKWHIYAAFVLPFMLWILALHGAEPTSVEYAPLTARGTHFDFFSIGIPGIIQGPAIIIGILAYMWVLGECFLRLRRLGHARELLPSVGVFLSQGLWFAVPVIARVLVAPEKLGPFGAQSASFTFIWISLMHGLQYLWITNYYVKKERPGSTAPKFLAKSLLMGTALYGIPVLVLAPLLAGRVSFDGGLELMLAAALNIHHIVLDSAIWKLRNARIAKILIRGADSVEDIAAPKRLHWVRAVVLASGVFGVTFALWSASERRNGVQIAVARGDVERLEKAARRMSWMGRDSAATRSQLGYLLGERGDSARAIAEFERSIAIEPNAAAWTNIGALQEREGNIEEALSAYDSALALDPDDVSALQYAARVLIKTGRPDRARPLLERAMTLAPDRADIRDLFEEATRG